MSEQFFTTPKYTSGGKKFTQYRTIKAGEVIQGRIIPAVKKLESTGEWRKFYACHFGYEVPNQSNDKSHPELFECVLDMDFNTKIVRRACAECTKNEKVKKEVERLKALYEGEGKSEEEIKTLLSPKNGYLQKHNRDSKWYINFMMTTGEVIVLLLSNTTVKNLLLPLLKEYESTYKKDPLLAGLLLEFTATGKKLDKADKISTVSIHEEVEINGKMRTVAEIQVVPWTAAEAALVKSEGMDLTTPDRFKVISADQIQLLVNCDGDPKEVRDIFSMGAVRKEASPAAAVAENTEAALRAQLAEIERKQAAAKPATVTATPNVEKVQQVKKPVPTASTAAVDAMSDQDFLTMIKGESKQASQSSP